MFSRIYGVRVRRPSNKCNTNAHLKQSLPINARDKQRLARKVNVIEREGRLDYLLAAEEPQRAGEEGVLGVVEGGHVDELVARVQRQRLHLS